MKKKPSFGEVEQMAQYQLEQENRARNLAVAFNALKEHPFFNELIQQLEELGEKIKDACIKEPDPEGVKWYQAEYAIFQSIIKKINYETRPAEEEPAEPAID